MNHHRIRRMTVTGGFLDGLDIEFSDGLNCLIGGRGSGKTTILEVLRYALDRFPDGDNGGQRKPSKRFNELIAANLDRGTVEIEFETQDGLVYKIERTVGEAPVVIKSDGERANLSILHSGILIDAGIFSQNEVEEIAMRSSYLREVIDRFCTRDLGKIQQDIAQVRAALQRNATELIQISLRTQKSEAALRDLPDYEAKLAKLKETVGSANLGPALEEAARLKELRTRESAALSRIQPTLDFVKERLAPVRGDVIGDFKQVFTAEVLAGPHGKIFREVQEALARGNKQFQDAISEAENALSQMEESTRLARSDLASSHGPIEAAYQELLKKHQVHQQLLREMHALAGKVAELHAIKEEEARHVARQREVLDERKSILARFSDLTEARFRLREQVAKDLNSKLGGRIQVRVEQDADRDQYKAFLVDQRDQTFRQCNRPIDRIVQSVPPRTLAALIAERDLDGLVTRADIDENFAKGMMHGPLSLAQNLYQLEVMELEDVPAIELMIGNQWRPSHQLSTGQMCSVVLPLLLLENVAPLLVDQPEDNLDNSFVADVVVKQVEKMRRNRQMIFITHNPNIPVLGMAEKVVAMDSDGARGWVKAEGTVDEMKDQIIDLLEGGATAFKTRKERYGW